MIVPSFKRKKTLAALGICYLIQVCLAGLVYARMPDTLESLASIGALLAANAAILVWVAGRFGLGDKPGNEELLPFILNDLNDGIFDYDLVTNKISYSRSYRAMLGYASKELGGHQDDFYSYVHPDDLPAAVLHMRQFLRQEIPAYNNTFRVRHKNGNWVWVMSRGVGLRNRHGKFYRLIGTHTDITAQKQREEDLKRLVAENERQREELVAAKEKAESANEAKTEFLATMSHEIRTPMNAVVGLAEIMLKTRLDPRQLEMMETLHANTGILLRLVNNILDFERIELGQVDFEMRSFTFENVFASLHAMFASQAASKNIKFRLVNGLGDQLLTGDYARIEQILINLVGNALKFTLEGEITVSATGEVRGDNEALVHIAVTDTGVGIPKDKLTTIFERFMQADQSISRRFGGSGLGLAISRSLARLMKGDITVDSEVGKGSTFTVSLPLRMEKSSAAPVVHKLQPERRDTAAHGTILLVEDHAANVLVASMMLEDLSYTVDVAKNGAEAVAKIEARTSPYAAVLMDVQMHGMDGYETTRRIRALEKGKGFRNYIIGVTANALVGDREKCLDAGMDDYMSKPINGDMLQRKISGATVWAA